VNGPNQPLESSPLQTNAYCRLDHSIDQHPRSASRTSSRAISMRHRLTHPARQSLRAKMPVLQRTPMPTGLATATRHNTSHFFSLFWVMIKSRQNSRRQSRGCQPHDRVAMMSSSRRQIGLPDRQWSVMQKARIECGQSSQCCQGAADHRHQRVTADQTTDAIKWSAPDIYVENPTQCSGSGTQSSRKGNIRRGMADHLPHPVDDPAALQHQHSA